VLLDPRSIDIYFENEEEVINAVNTIKSDRVYGKIRAQLEGETVGENVDQNQNTSAGGSGDRRAELIARKTARFGGSLPTDAQETFQDKIDKEFSK
jgi:hypothetical protein